MTNSKRKTLGAAALALGLVALMLVLILTAVHSVGTDAARYHELQTLAGVLPGAGISDGDLRALDGRLADYLAGNEGALMEGGSVALLYVDGELRPAFNDRETAHLWDCFRLFALLRKVRRRLIPWVVLLIVGGAYLLNDRRRARRAALLSPLILLIPLGAFSLWAVRDFDAAFTCFHRVLFTNDLWLLDPATDLLIRICPEGLFMGLGRDIGLRALAILAGAPLAAAGLTLIWPKSKSKGASQWKDNRATRRAAAQRPKTFDVGGKR